MSNQQSQQPPAPNRLQLNFGFNNNERNAGVNDPRQYPTTPSTFPQPIYSNQNGQQEVWGNNQNPYGNNNYFLSNPYQATFNQQGGQSQQGPGNSQFRSPPPPANPVNAAANQFQTQSQNPNDPANGLAQQFAHQNLGGNTPRSASPYDRQQSPANAQQQQQQPQQGQQRPRTAGATGQQGHTQYGNFLSPQMPAAAGSQTSLSDDEPPQKNPDRYGEAVLKKSKVSCGLVSTFFKDNVNRARDRNHRAQELEAYLNDPNTTEVRKQHKLQSMRRAEAHYLRFLRTKERAENFQTIKIIGKGAFGEVRLVQRRNDGKIYALKSLIKTEMFKKDQLAHVRSERDILAEADSPWVVKLHTTFQDTTFLYMLMEFLPGGDLMTMLIKYEIFSEDITRFYMAEITLAIEAVHKLGFIHRDIKPDNILLDRGGHIKLTDFGLSTGFHKEHQATFYQELMSKGKPKTQRDNRNSINFDQISLTVSNRSQINTWRKSRRQLAYSTVGTPDYIAPEIFSGRGYDYGCDWWSVGTIMFECLIGWPPFCAEEAVETYRKIVEWPRHLHFPPDQPLGHQAEDFVRRLICDAENRLGRLGGAHEIKSHPFFQGVQWDSLRRIRAPFEPRLTSNVDTQYFPIEEIPQQDNTAALRAQTAAQGDEVNTEMSLPFIGYTYKRFDAFRGS